MRSLGLASLASCLLVSGSTSADTVQVDLNGGSIQSVTAGGVTIPVHKLRTGKSSGAVELNTGTNDGFAITAADTKSLVHYFARTNGVAPEWDIDLGTWRDTNGGAHDFFIFEVGGNDSITVAARFPGGTYGDEVTVSGWTSTNYSVPTGPNAGQTVYGLALKSIQLRDTNGNPLASNATITGLRVRSDSVDGAAFLAVDAQPSGGPGTTGNGAAFIVGKRRVSQPIELHFRGPWASESSNSPNPFLDYRFNVEFSGPGGVTYNVPGFFNTDAAGGDAGNIWTARFVPDVKGTWTATASFREGNDVAIALAANAGSAGFLDGRSTTFEVLPRDSNAPGFWKYGQLEYVGEHYQKFKNGPYFIKGGTNSPENFMGYRGFDGVTDAGGIGILHRYAEHAADWQAGDPYFVSDVHGVDSKGVIGALNYLSSVGVNSVFAIIMNLGGDGQDAHPFLGPRPTAFNKTHYDVGRLNQWNIVFEHAASRGVALHFGLAETETSNENWLDNGNLGTERKLFFREMAARFAHLPAVKWTLCEENDYSQSDLRDFADFLRAHDAYGNLVTFHNHTDDFSDYNALAGDQRFDATSIQYWPDNAGDQAEDMRQLSISTGHRWVVHMDENNPAGSGLTDSNANDLRKRVLYDVLFSGAQIEWYGGYHNLPLGGDVKLENFRTREEMWLYMFHARRFMEAFLPFWEMTPADSLVSGEASNYGGAEVFIRANEAYAIYLPSAANSSATINLSGASGTFNLRWFNPRSGLFEGTTATVTGGGNHVLGSAPSSPSEDWVLLIDRPGSTLTTDVGIISTSNGGTQRLLLDAGSQNAGRAYLVVGSRSGVFPGFRPGSATVPLSFDSYTRFTIQLPNTSIHVNTSGTLDGNGQAVAEIVMPPGFFNALAGTTLHHAYLLFSPLDFASEAVPLVLVP